MKCRNKHLNSDCFMCLLFQRQHLKILFDITAVDQCRVVAGYGAGCRFPTIDEVQLCLAHAYMPSL